MFFSLSLLFLFLSSPLLLPLFSVSYFLSSSIVTSSIHSSNKIFSAKGLKRKRKGRRERKRMKGEEKKWMEKREERNCWLNQKHTLISFHFSSSPPIHSETINLFPFKRSEKEKWKKERRVREKGELLPWSLNHFSLKNVLLCFEVKLKKHSFQLIEKFFFPFFPYLHSGTILWPEDKQCQVTKTSQVSFNLVQNHLQPIQL